MDDATSAWGLADLLLVGAAVGTVTGSLFFDASDPRRVRFVKSGGLLQADDYTLTLRSGSTGWKTLDGGLLDGNADGSGGDDYSTLLTVNSTYGNAITMPDFARGYGQSVDLVSTGGIPLTIADANGVTEVQLEILYNPGLLTLTDALLASGIPADATVTLDTSIPGRALLEFNSITPLSGTNLDLIVLEATVPTTASYGASQVIELTDVQINQTEALSDIAVHLAVMPGDLDGSRTITANDEALLSDVVNATANGVDYLRELDPRLVGDLDGDQQLTSADVSLLNQKVQGQTVAEIPDLPGVTFLPKEGRPQPQWVSLPIDIAANQDSATLTFNLLPDNKTESETLGVRIANPHSSQPDGYLTNQIAMMPDPSNPGQYVPVPVSPPGDYYSPYYPPEEYYPPEDYYPPYYPPEEYPTDKYPIESPPPEYTPPDYNPPIEDDPVTISMTTNDLNLSEADPDSGSITITRAGGDLNEAFSVHVYFEGDATFDEDFTLTGITNLTDQGGTLTFDAGVTSQVIDIQVLQDNLVEDEEELQIFFYPTTYVDYESAYMDYYSVVTIEDDPAIVTIEATDATASEPGVDTGTFVIRRTGGKLSEEITVALSLYGSARLDEDYELSDNLTVFIPENPYWVGGNPWTHELVLEADETEATVTVTPIDDSHPEGTESVTLGILPNSIETETEELLGVGSIPIYELGEDSFATVEITDNEYVDPFRLSNTVIVDHHSFSIEEESSTGLIPLVSFTDADLTRTAGDYTATIRWGRTTR